MTRLMRGLFALCLLTSLAGWLDHLYHQHDLKHDDLCEHCLVGCAQDHVVTASEKFSFQKPAYFIAPKLTVSDLRVEWIGTYHSRAPPCFLCLRETNSI
jgi:hypothetical protein